MYEPYCDRAWATCRLEAMQLRALPRPCLGGCEIPECMDATVANGSETSTRQVNSVFTKVNVLIQLHYGDATNIHDRRGRDGDADRDEA